MWEDGRLQGCSLAGCVPWGDRLWLLMNGHRDPDRPGSVPIAYEVHSKRLSLLTPVALIGQNTTLEDSDPEPIELGPEDKVLVAPIAASMGAAFIASPPGHRIGHLWCGQLENGAGPRPIMPDVLDLAVLGERRAVFKTFTDTKHGVRETGYCYEFATGTVWDLLDSVDVLPPLPADLQAYDFVEDQQRVELVPSFGSATRQGLVLALLRQSRGDRRALLIGERILTERQTWSAWLLLGPDGRRYRVAPPPGFEEPDRSALLLHHSATLVLIERPALAGRADPLLHLTLVRYALH